MQTKNTKSVIVGLLLAILAAGNVLAGGGRLKAGEEAKLCIPHMQAPTLDGKVTEAEWGNAAALGGPVDIGSDQLDSRPATFLLGWDEKNIYMAVRAWRINSAETRTAAPPAS